MGDFDPVSWETSEAALGSPASEIETYVETMEEDVHEKIPYNTLCDTEVQLMARFIADCMQFTIDVAIRPIPRDSSR